MSEKKEYIERGAFIDFIDAGHLRYATEKVFSENDLVKMISERPAADVEPVVRGELRINEQGYLECSACGKTLRMPLVSTHEMKRCYICGAYLERSGSGE